MELYYLQLLCVCYREKVHRSFSSFRVCKTVFALSGGSVKNSFHRCLQIFLLFILLLQSSQEWLMILFSKPILILRPLISDSNVFSLSTSEAISSSLMSNMRARSKNTGFSRVARVSSRKTSLVCLYPQVFHHR